MSKKRWFRFYTERWRDGTFGLSPNEIAAYITVLCELYDHDGTLINPDMDIMARRCGMRPSSFRKALDVLVARGKLSVDGVFITSKAVSEEIISREKLDQKSTESRAKGAGKANEYNAIRKKLVPNKEERIQNNTTFQGSALPLPNASNAKKPTSAKSESAVQGYLHRRAMFARQ